MIDRLESALPGLLSGIEPAARPNWIALDAALGSGFPEDFKALADHYQSFEIDDFLAVPLPTRGSELEFISNLRYSCEDLRESISEDDVPGRYLNGLPIFDDPSLHLLRWGFTVDGDFLWWWVNSSDPNKWTIVMQGRSGGWWEFSMGILEFLAGVYSGTLSAPGFPASISQWGKNVTFF